MLKQRILTAIILVPIVLLVLFYAPPPVFLIVTAILFFAAAWEWCYLVGIVEPHLRVLYLLLIAIIFYLMLFVAMPLTLMVAFVWWWVAIISIILYPRARIWWSRFLPSRLLMGILVIVPCWVALNFLRVSPSGIWHILFLFVLIWGADTFAYFVGRKWGKHKLCPLVSPGKTLEGLVGAILGTTLIVVILLTYLQIQLPYWPYILILSLVTVLFSVIGDLFESMIKRQAGIKDSGNILPGHGGLLDRIDSLTAAAPIYALGLWLLQFVK